jgi:hypothetical protein
LFGLASLAENCAKASLMRTAGGVSPAKRNSFGLGA